VTGAELDRAEKSLAAIAARQKQVMARIDQAKADLDTARVRAGYALITSPINGVVTARQTDIGQTASPGVPLLTIEDSDNYQIEAAVEESRISAVHLGDSVAIGVDALGDRFEGRVTQIVPSSDPASRSFTVKIDLPGDGFKKGLRSGLFARAVFSVGEKQALLILSRAVSRHGQLTSVYVVDQSGIARSRFVKTGVVYGERVEVLSGLEQGERIIVDNLDSVRDGSRVTADGEYE
jgi:RND family efflux transporter MFP subunit